MSTLLDPTTDPVLDDDATLDATQDTTQDSDDLLGLAVGPEDDGDDDAPDDTISPAALGFTVASGALSAAAAAWMIGGMFRGPEARLVGLVGVVIGAGLMFAATRFRSTILQYLVLPVSGLVGAVLIGSAAGAGTSSVPALVRDAISSSQVLQPPIDPAPGWRLILVVVLALVAAAACALGLSTARPRVAVVVPVPLVLVAALVQPGETAIVTGAVSVAFLLMAMSTSFAADGVGDSFDRGFEARRIARSVVGGVVLIGLLVAASQVSFLFPEDTSSRIIPPRRPPITPPSPDVPLYTAEGVLEGPLRLGVIDHYDLDEQAWMLPPVDNGRLERFDLPFEVPDGPAVDGDPSVLTVAVQQAEGRLLPTPSTAARISGDATVDYDPRTQSVSLVGRSVFTGLTYEVTSAPAPDGVQLTAADPAVPDEMEPFRAAPPAPSAITELLVDAPESPYARLQLLRGKLYENFIAAGQGVPTDVGPDRVVELMGGAQGNPYELTAAEALLARWVGIPSRIGFGYYDRTLADGGEAEFHPSDAATYLEIWFADHGWVSIVGTPPQAQQSLSNNQRDSDPNIQSAPELGISVFLPVVAPNDLPIYVYFRYYAVRVLPPIALLGAVAVLYPLWFKRRRRRRRAAWGVLHGPAGRIAVAYADLRDRMNDLALPGRGMTPLELVELVDEDEEHAELAWLVTRALWGDLRAALTEEDATAAEALAASVTDRITKAQPETARLLAAVSRASLTEPWSTSMPNVWWKRSLRSRLPRADLGRRLSRLWASIRRTAPGATAALLSVLAMLLVGGCAPAPADADLAATEPDVPFPTTVAPEEIGGLAVREEEAAADAYLDGASDANVIVDQGTVYSFSKNGLVQAALQLAELKPGYVTSDDEVSRAIVNSLGDVVELDPQRTYELFSQKDGSQRVYLWFPTAKHMALLVTRSAVPEGAAEALARALIDYGDGLEIEEAALEAAFATLHVPTNTTTEEAP